MAICQQCVQEVYTALHMFKSQGPLTRKFSPLLLEHPIKCLFRAHAGMLHARLVPILFLVLAHPASLLFPYSSLCSLPVNQTRPEEPRADSDTKLIHVVHVLCHEHINTQKPSVGAKPVNLAVPCLSSGHRNRNKSYHSHHRTIYLVWNVPLTLGGKPCQPI